MKNRTLLNLAAALILATSTAQGTFMFGGGDDDSNAVPLSKLFTPKNYSKLPGEKGDRTWHYGGQTTYVDEASSQAETLACITFALDIQYSEKANKKRKGNGEKHGEETQADKKMAVDGNQGATSTTSAPKSVSHLKVDLQSALPDILAHDSPGALFEYFKDTLSHKLLNNQFLPSEEDKKELVLLEELGSFDARQLEPRNPATKDKFHYSPDTIIAIKERASVRNLAMNQALYQGIRQAGAFFTQKFTFPDNNGEISLTIQQSTLAGQLTDEMQKLPHYPGEFFDALENWLTTRFNYIREQVEEKSPSSMHN